MGNFPRRGGGGRFSRQPRGPRRNDRIRVPEVRVIGPDGKQVGVMNTRDALALAQKAGLDLIEISPSARPPVCRVLDYGKYMYEQSKKDKDKKSSVTKMKEVKFRVRIDQHDFITKLRRAEEFLDKGAKLKLTLSFRGREMQHTELGFVVMKNAIEGLAHIGQADSQPRLVGRNITFTMSPLPSNKKKPLKYSNHVGVDEDEDDDFDDEAHDEVDEETHEEALNAADETFDSADESDADEAFDDDFEDEADKGD